MAPTTSHESDQLVRKEEAVKAQEGHLVDARRQRREVDDHVQTLMNRIAYLAQEEAKLDRDIESARRRAAEALARQGDRDQDVAATAQEVLAVLPAASGHKIRPHTGRSSLVSRMARGSSSGAAKPPSALGDVPRTPSTSAAMAGAVPPRAPSASRGRPPAAAPPAGSKGLEKSKSQGAATRAPSPGMRPGTTTSKSQPTSKTPSPGKPPPMAAASLHRSGRERDGQEAAPAASTTAGHDATVGTAGLSVARSDSSSAAMQRLSGPSNSSGSFSSAGHRTSAAAAAAVPNSMAVLHGATRDSGHDMLDADIVEELLQHAGSHTSACGGSVAGPSGLQEFATVAGGKRVVQVTAAPRKQPGEGSAAVLAGGVGWGLGSRGAPAPIPAKEAKLLAAEMAKKQQLWKVRKTFGLEPAPLSGAAAQVEEVGAGAWS